MSLSAITVYSNGILPDNSFGRIHGLNFEGVGIEIEVPSTHFIEDVGIATIRIDASKRLNISQTTSILQINESENLTFSDAFPEYKLLKVTTSDGAWVTIYTDNQSRINDQGRTIDTDPLPGSGVIAEVITTGTGITTQRLTPGVIGYNDDEEVSNNIYAKVVNNSGISTQIEVTLTISR